MSRKPAPELVLCDVVQSYSPISGGVKRYIADKMEYMRRRPELRHVLIIPGEEDLVRREGATTVYEIESPPFILSKSYRLLINRTRILEIIAEERPDAIEVDNAYIPAWITLEAHEIYHVPLFGFYHSDFPRAFGEEVGRYIHSTTVDSLLTRAIEYYLAELYNRMTCTITSTRQFRKKLNTMGVECVERVPLCTDTDRFTPRDSRAAVLEELELPQDIFLILFVGRLAEMKNLPQTFAMLDHLDPAQGPVHLLVVGDGEERDLVLEETKRRDNASWMRYISETDRLAELYSAADLFVNASLHETFGLVSLEAQSCGARVLGVRGGGMDETLEGETPLIMAATDAPEDLAAALQEIRALDEGPEARRRRRARIVERFSIEATFDALTNVYRKYITAAAAGSDR